MPRAPINQLAMLADYIDPGDRIVVCPNQDVVYGAGVLALEKSPKSADSSPHGRAYWPKPAITEALLDAASCETGELDRNKLGSMARRPRDWMRYRK